MADAIIKGLMILPWFIGAGAISLIVIQTPFVKNWIDKYND